MSTENEAVNMSFSPRQVIPNAEIDQSFLDSLNNVIESIKSQKKIENPTFRDLVRYMIENEGYEATGDIFNGLAEVWKKSGKKFDENTRNVYNSFFKTEEEELNEIKINEIGIDIPKTTPSKEHKPTVSNTKKKSVVDELFELYCFIMLLLFAISIVCMFLITIFGENSVLDYIGKSSGEALKSIFFGTLIPVILYLSTKLNK